MTLILSGTDGLSDVDGSAATPAIRGTDANTGIFFPAADTIAFAEGGAEVARFDSSGNFGIGGAPTQKLDVYGGAGAAVSLVRAASGQNAFFSVAGNGNTFLSTSFDIVQDSTNLAQIAQRANAAMAFSTNNTERMRIDSSGNVGIGTSSPSGRLHVESSSGGLPLYVNSTASAQNARIRLNSTDNASSVSYVMSYSHASLNKQAAMLLGGTGSVGFYVGQTAGAEPTTGTLAQTIDSSGNLLVGAASQIGSEKLGVTSGTTNATQYTTIATKGGSTLNVNQQQTTSVSTSATVILASPSYLTFCLVHGSDGTNRFSDVVSMSVATGTVNVINSLSAGGSPAARTYSQASSTFKLAMASGTYTVQVTALTMNS